VLTNKYAESLLPQAATTGGVCSTVDQRSRSWRSPGPRQLPSGPLGPNRAAPQERRPGQFRPFFLALLQPGDHDPGDVRSFDRGQSHMARR